MFQGRNNSNQNSPESQAQNVLLSSGHNSTTSINHLISVNGVVSSSLMTFLSPRDQVELAKTSTSLKNTLLLKQLEQFLSQPEIREFKYPFIPQVKHDLESKLKRSILYDASYVQFPRMVKAGYEDSAKSIADLSEAITIPLMVLVAVMLPHQIESDDDLGCKIFFPLLSMRSLNYVFNEAIQAELHSQFKLAKRVLKSTVDTLAMPPLLLPSPGGKLDPLESKATHRETNNCVKTIKLVETLATDNNNVEILCRERDMTPLHCAAVNPGANLFVPQLLKKGAGIDRQNAQEKSPLLLEQEKGNDLAIKTLQIHDAKSCMLFSKKHGEASDARDGSADIRYHRNNLRRRGFVF